MLVAAVAVAGLAALWGQARALSAAALVVALAAGFCALRTRTDLSDRSRLEVDARVAIEAVVCSRSASLRRVELSLCDARSVGAARELPARIRLVESRDAQAIARLAAWSVGERMRAELLLRPLREAGNPGQRSRLASDRRRGIGATARLVDPLLCVRMAGSARDAEATRTRIEALRQRIARRLTRAGSGGALLSALAVGDRSALRDADQQHFRRLGISHLLAVSGLHLGLAASAAYLLLRAFGVRITSLSSRVDVRTPAMLLACLFAAGYALLAGWGVPVQRALSFLLVAAAARLAGRGLAPLQLLSAAVIAVGAAEPAALFEAGPQLSFAASAALLWALAGDAAPTDRRLARRLLDGVALGLRTTAIAVAVTAPILVVHGLPLAPVALIANALAVPLTSLLLLPLALLSAAVAPWTGWLSHGLLTLAEAVASFALSLAARAAEALPELEVLPTPQPIYVAASVGVALLAMRARRPALRVALAVAIVGGLRLAPPPLLAPPPPRLVSFDVGLGDAVLVEAERGRVLVDGAVALPGGFDVGRGVVLPALRALDVAALDVVVATHADADHRGGLPAVLEALPVGELWLPVGTRGDPDFARLLAAAAARNVRVVERGLGDARRRVGDLEIETLWPPRDGLPRSRNDASLVLRVHWAGRRVLLTGDIGARVEAALLQGERDVSAEILKVAHHGSRSASSPAFLAAVGAQVALISAPCSTRAPLPSTEARVRLRRAGAAVWWTGRRGAVFVSGRSRATPIVAWSWLANARSDCAERAP